MDEFAFGPWLPDVTDFRNPGLEVCRNVVPTRRGYRPTFKEELTGDSVTGTVIGTASFEQPDGDSVVIVCTTSDLYHISDSVVTASGLSLTLTGTDTCAFEQFNDNVFASIRGAETYYLPDFKTDTAFVVSPGTPPSAKTMGRVSDFLLMGNLTDIDASDAPYRLRWSAFNNPTGTWETAISTQSGAIDLNPTYGVIQAISGGDVGIIFQKQGISRIVYTGSASVFDIDDYEKERGCIAPESVVRIGADAYFVGSDGLFRTNGTEVSSISNGLMWDWFQENVDFDFIHTIRGAADWESRCVVWSVPLVLGGRGQIWYSWDTGAFSYVESTVDYIVTAPRSGIGLDSLDTDFPSVDTMEYSLDHPRFRATGRAPLGFIGSDMAAMTGVSREAVLASGDMQPIPGRRSFIDEITPIIKGDAGVTVKVSHRGTQQEAVTVSPLAQIGPLGYAPVNIDARYYAFEFTIPEGAIWSDAYGFQVNATDSGV